jgi:hypothetical protein
MGMATGYGVSKIAPFVKSLRASGYQGDVLLLVGHMDAELEAFFREYRVDTDLFSEAHFLPMDRQLARFFTYYRILKTALQLGTAPRRVLLTDVRDVVFQGDPFQGLPALDILAVLEDPSMTLATCPFNARWIVGGYGESMLKQIGSARISCSGTIYGSSHGLLRYLLLMIKGAYECAPLARLQMLGIDQGIHNVLVNRYRVPVMENGQLVWTLHYVQDSAIRVSDGRVFDPKGHAPSVLHQYDRKAALVKLMDELWGGQLA